MLFCRTCYPETAIIIKKKISCVARFIPVINSRKHEWYQFAQCIEHLRGFYLKEICLNFFKRNDTIIFTNRGQYCKSVTTFQRKVNATSYIYAPKNFPPGKCQHFDHQFVFRRSEITYRESLPVNVDIVESTTVVYCSVLLNCTIGTE